MGEISRNADDDLLDAAGALGERGGAHGGLDVALGLDGQRETIVKVPQQPSGLGWLPDGRLLVVSMKDRKVMRLERAAIVRCRGTGSG